MAEKIGSDVISEDPSEEPRKVPKTFQFHGNPWERRTHYRNKILKLLISDPDRSFNATEVSEIVECNPQTAQLILLEMALEHIVSVQITKQGYSKLFRINLDQVGKDITQVKPKMTFDYRKEE